MVYHIHTYSTSVMFYAKLAIILHMYITYFVTFTTLFLFLTTIFGKKLLKVMYKTFDQLCQNL